MIIAEDIIKAFEEQEENDQENLALYLWKDVAWAPPPPIWIKVNSDGAVKSLEKGGAAAVFWDSGGDLL